MKKKLSTLFSFCLLLVLSPLSAQSFLYDSDVSKFYKFYYNDPNAKDEHYIDSDTEFYKYLIWLRDNPYSQPQPQYQVNGNNQRYSYQVGPDGRMISDTCNSGCGGIDLHISIDMKSNGCCPQPIRQPVQQVPVYYQPQQTYYPPIELPSPPVPAVKKTPAVKTDINPWKLAVSGQAGVSEPWGATGQNNGIGYNIQAQIMIRPYFWNQKRELKPWRYGLYVGRSHFTGDTKQTTEWEPPEGTYADIFGLAVFARYDITELFISEPIIGVYTAPALRFSVINYNNPHPDEYAEQDIPVPTGVYNTFGAGFEFGAYFFFRENVSAELKVYQTYDYNKIFEVLGQLNVIQRAHMENGVKLGILYRF